MDFICVPFLDDTSSTCTFLVEKSQDLEALQLDDKVHPFCDNNFEIKFEKPHRRKRSMSVGAIAWLEDDDDEEQNETL